MDYTKKVSEYIGSGKLALINTFGCQQNENDSEKIAGILHSLGYGFTDDARLADLIIFNTCAIRENAEKKVYGMLGALKPLKEMRPSLIIALCGCMANEDVNIKKIKSTFKQVDIVFGTNSIQELPRFLYEYLSGSNRVICTQEDYLIHENIPYFRSDSLKAGVPIMYGCNNFCTYCIVPYVRGRERSRSEADILSEVNSLIADGCREVMLLGQNVNAWHGEDENGKPSSLDKLIYALAKIEGLDRIRFVTSYPSDMTDELIEVFGKEPKLMPYLHLPIQSGSDKVLKAMNRRYTVQEYNKIIEKLRDVRPDIAISSDFIVGFAGEDDNDFNNTLDLVDKIRFASSFSFKYSPRAGTVGAAMRGQVPEDVKGARLTVLQAKLQEYQLLFNQACLGKELEVLIEGRGSKAGEFVGHSPYMQTVIVPSEEDIVGRIVKVKITRSALNNLVGEAI